MSGHPPVHGRCDGSDCLVEADDPLAGLQIRCGGKMPGMLAIPALLALVRKVRHAGIAQECRLTAFDEGKLIAFFASVIPDGSGTRIELRQWRMIGETHPEAGLDAGAGDILLHQLAAAHALLDPEQHVLTADLLDRGDAGLAGLVARWQGAPGEAWSNAVEIAGLTHQQPLHWRLMDDTVFTVEGGETLWRARLLPRGDHGFDLLIIPESLPEPAEEPVVDAGKVVENGWSRAIGRDLAPALLQPITRIIANAETIRTRLAGPLAEDYTGYAADIADAGRHLLDLVEDLADLDAVESPGFAPAPDRIDLGDCARRAAGILGVRAQERSIRLITPPEGMVVPAIGEFRRVLQILLNLITNAIRYGPANSTVTITVLREENAAWVSVADEGDGLSAEQAARVFDKFERLGRSGDGGSGLGLYISRRLARAMGGDLVVAGPGPGACFILSLPVPPVS